MIIQKKEISRAVSEQMFLKRPFWNLFQFVWKLRWFFRSGNFFEDTKVEAKSTSLNFVLDNNNIIILLILYYKNIIFLFFKSQ